MEEPEGTLHHFIRWRDRVLRNRRIEAPAETGLAIAEQEERSRPDGRGLLAVLPVMAETLDFPGRKAHKVALPRPLDRLTEGNDFPQNELIAVVELDCLHPYTAPIRTASFAGRSGRIVIW